MGVSWDDARERRGIFMKWPFVITNLSNYLKSVTDVDYRRYFSAAQVQTKAPRTR